MFIPPTTLSRAGMAVYLSIINSRLHYLNRSYFEIAANLFPTKTEARTVVLEYYFDLRLN